MTDFEEERLKSVADELGALAIKVDVSKESDIIHAVKETEKQFGRVDLFCSNAGISDADVPGWTAASSPDNVWQKQWEVHVMAHVYAARAVLPGMIERGKGYLLNTASAAGLLNQIGCAAYSTTKHAAVGFAESLAITHGSDGIKVSVICPQAVKTRMIETSEEGSASVDGVLSPVRRQQVNNLY
jgi:NAD(P)-dependent dehydrogenase (short-subunit alcohol dehydrogenase family)